MRKPWRRCRRCWSRANPHSQWRLVLPPACNACKAGVVKTRVPHAMRSTLGGLYVSLIACQVLTTVRPRWHKHLGVARS
jgi:hypothetical protein